MKHSTGINDNKFPDLMIPTVDHKEPADEDVGLPNDPIFSDYSKYLWKSHTRSGGIQSPNRSPENTDGPKSN